MVPGNKGVRHPWFYHYALYIIEYHQLYYTRLYNILFLSMLIYALFGFHALPTRGVSCSLHYTIYQIHIAKRLTWYHSQELVCCFSIYPNLLTAFRYWVYTIMEHNLNKDFVAVAVSGAGPFVLRSCKAVSCVLLGQVFLSTFLHQVLRRCPKDYM